MIKSLSVYRPAPYVTRRLRCRLLCDNAWSADDTPRVRMDACSQCLAREFRSENAGLGYENPPVFVTSQWPVRQRFYVVYRALIAVAITGWCAADITYESTTFYDYKVWKWFIFATNWSFLLLALSAIYNACTVAVYTCRPYWIMDPMYPRSMPIVLRLQWIIYNLSCNSAIVVTMSYWSFVAFFSHSELLATPMSRVKHTMNTVYVIIDVMITGAPLRVLHMFMTITLGSVYALFNAIYFLNDGTVTDSREERHYAYNFMNWNKPVEAVITCVLCVLQAMLAQVILNFLYRLRMWVFSKFYYIPDDPTLDSEMQNIVMSTSTSYNAVDDKSLANDGRYAE
ncbi:protein rolling stone-like [Haliotis rufescens]|uniref:protein rolling stone-like n=1 Tax=Haliotis rufescens TaxID=6454 RepID=UPI001EAFF0A6|nr:protein rolling stone-like [Haliotis rufescens]